MAQIWLAPGLAAVGAPRTAKRMLQLHLAIKEWLMDNHRLIKRGRVSRLPLTVNSAVSALDLTPVKSRPETVIHTSFDTNNFSLRISRTKR